MNKRIQQLVEQAMVEKKNVPCKGTDGWTTLETVRQIDPEKLAELIVKECAVHVFNGDPSDGQRLKIGMEIKHHFGIE